MLKFINTLNNSIKIGQIYVKTSANGYTPISSVYQVTNNGLQKLFGTDTDVDPDIPTPDIPTHTHTWNTTWSADNTGHWKKCKYCSEITNKASHSPDRTSPTETLPVKCTICDYIIQPATGHVNHNYVKTKISDATCTEPAKYQNICDGCGQAEGNPYTEGTALGHDFSGAYWVNGTPGNSTEHWKTCLRCGEWGYRGSHTTPTTWTYENETQHKGVCPVCNNGTYAYTLENHDILNCTHTITNGVTTYTAVCSKCGKFTRQFSGSKCPICNTYIT